MSNQGQFIRQTAAVLMACGLIVSLLPGFAASCRAQVPAGPDIPELPELNWEPRSDWLNVKRDVTPAAVGDGVADDTAALQGALDEINGKMYPGGDDWNSNSPYSTVYLPPGTYRITRELYPRRHERLKGYQGVDIRGHGRSTRVVWDGPEGGTMFRSSGFSKCSYIGVVWDGRGKAARGFIHDGGHETKVLHEHQAFMNFTDTGSGTTPPDYLEGSEWRNCLFVNCNKGVAIWGFNDLVLTINGCDFYDCGQGIWMERGDFFARNCHFERSRQADVWINNDNVGCSVRRCTSVGSRAFYHNTSSVVMAIQDCHVSGWTNPEYAVFNNGISPLLVFDCVFTHPPSENPPVRLGRPHSVVHSNNRTVTPQLFGGSTQHVVEVPKGERGGSITSARQSFFRSEVAIPTKVFDAKRDFGGNVQKCIDAAREHGRGAIAYLPRGKYGSGKTIHITGGNYYVGGSHASLIWAEATMLATDPQNVTLEHLSMVGITVRIESRTATPSRMHLKHVNSAKKFEAVGLSKDSVLTFSSAHTVGDGILVDNCSSARILINYLDGRPIHVKGTQIDRSGFLGVQVSQPYLMIEDNQSLVGGDVYAEQMGNPALGTDRPYAVLRGSPTLPAGRVTLSAPKMHGWGLGRTGKPYEVYFTVDNYRGRLSNVRSDYWNTQPKMDPDKKAFKVVCSGEAPIDVLLMGNVYMGGGHSEDRRTLPVIEGGGNVTRTVLGCWATGPGSQPVPNALHADSLRLAAQALDDFRELGALDLELNHGDR